MLRPSIFRDNFVENVFDDFFRDPFWQTTGVRSVSAMKTDIQDMKDGYQIDMELPGFAREDVKAELKDGYLTVRAAHSEEKESKGKGSYIRKERYSGHYERSFYVGEQVTQEDISAKFKDGVLKLTMPKLVEQKPEPKKLTIR